MWVVVVWVLRWIAVVDGGACLAKGQLLVSLRASCRYGGSCYVQRVIGNEPVSVWSSAQIVSRG